MVVSQVELAAELGLSQNSVSAALRGAKGVSDGTRQRVLSTAEKLGYRPNAAARSMKRGHFGAVGVLQSRHGNLSMVPQEVLWSFEESLSEQNYHLVIGQISDQRLAKQGQLPLLLREWTVDAMLLSYTVNPPAAIEDAIGRGASPAVWINTKRDHDAVRPDDFGASQRITRELLEMGHRRVVYLDRPVTKPALEHYSVSDRRAGYSAAMEQGGLKPVVLEAPHWGWHLRKMTEQVAWAKQIMSDPSDRPTAVVARSRNAAQWFMRGAELAGARVPSDLSLIGFDKHPKTQTLEMEIGSLVLPLGPMGHELARMVFEKIDAGGRRLPSVVMPLAINYGDTVAPPDRSPN